MFYRTDPTGRARAREPASEGALGTSDLLVPLARRDQPPAPAKPDSAMRDARGPPTTREEYVALIADAIADAAARAPPARRAVPPGDGEHADRDPPSLEKLAAPSARAGRWTVYAVSDLHADVRANADWARALPVHPPFSALIVAGDVATSPATVVDTLAHLKRKFEEVFFCPGNHEMWTPPPPNEHADAGHPPDSLGKLKHLIERVSSIGVRVAPTLLPGSPAPTTNSPDAPSRRASPRAPPASVVVVPMLSWYDDAFGERMGRGPGYSPVEAHFDAGCSWPACVGRPGAPRDSHPDSIATFFVDVNARVGAGGDPRAARRFAGVPLDDDDDETDASTDADAVSFSHFVPRPSLYRGTRALAKVMGSATLGSAVRTLRPAAHVFGHSHGDVDETVDGTRYVQRALGYPNERWGGWADGAGGAGGAFVSPARVWPPSDRRRDVLDAFAACALA
jgi:hypothetical protein